MQGTCTYNVYSDIKKRTNGEIYLGVVGAVRTGKSTFIKRFMELLVLPAIKDPDEKKRTIDELPQSSEGLTIMTTEPKFIPRKAVTINLGDETDVSVRLIDSVGYVVDMAKGYMEDGEERRVNTPWNQMPISFRQAAEVGTEKVITDHSTLGIVITNDGTITEIPRENYISGTDSAVKELAKHTKPYIIIMNTRTPDSEETKQYASVLSERYKKNVYICDCDKMKIEDIKNIFNELLSEFPVTEIDFKLPVWSFYLDGCKAVRDEVLRTARNILDNINVINDTNTYRYNELEDTECSIKDVRLTSIDASCGKITYDIGIDDKLFYKTLTEMFGTNINGDASFYKEISRLADTRLANMKMKDAFLSAKACGYGSVSPSKDEIKLGSPELIKTGGRYGVRIKAEAPSMHFIKANITTEIAPIVGSMEQAKDLIKYMESESSGDDIYAVNIFGKSIEELVFDGFMSKVNKINNESKQKLQNTMEKIVNDSNGGMVCIII